MNESVPFYWLWQFFKSMALIAPKTLDCHTGLDVSLTFEI